MTSSQFKLRKDSVIYDSLSHAHYSNHNLTDTAALNLLASNPRYAKSFESLPDNWEKMVEDHKLGIEIANEEKSKKAEDDDTGDAQTLEQYIEFVTGSTKKALQKECRKANLPVAEWSNRSQESLAEYLISRFQNLKIA